jgi:Protein of unknown function (DUF3891)
LAPLQIDNDSGVRDQYVTLPSLGRGLGWPSSGAVAAVDGLRPHKRYTDMMSQTAPEGEPHFVITMREHLDLCGQMARAFGNELFEAPAPYEQVIYAIDNHDRGWDEYDENPGIDPDTGLPYIMARTPLADALKTNKGSPDFNEAHHPYSGLLSSMHTWGLYNRRYGFTNFVIRGRTAPTIPVQTSARPQVDAMLAAEEDRQSRLRGILAKDPATQSWIEERHLFQNYKQLTFIDTLSLYFHLYHATERGEETYVHVPMNAEADCDVTVKKVDEGVYSLDPFPFAENRLKLVCRGRYTKPFPRDFDRSKAGAALRALPPDRQTYELVAS